MVVVVVLRFTAKTWRAMQESPNFPKRYTTDGSARHATVCSCRSKDRKFNSLSRKYPEPLSCCQFVDLTFADPKTPHQSPFEKLV